jgi:hypothetical protein
MEEKMYYEREHHHSHKWVPPTSKVVDPGRDMDMDCRKDLLRIVLYFNKQGFSVLGQKKIATQQAAENEFKKRRG